MFRMTRHNQTTLVSGSLDTMQHLLDEANIPAVNRHRVEPMRERRRSGWRDHYTFGNVGSFEDARDLLIADGWQEGVDRARAELPTLPLADLVPEAVAMKRRRVFGEDGDTLRVDAALAGQWDRAWETRARRSSRQPVTLSIGCGFGANGGVSHDNLFWCGLQMAALVDLLENAGFRVELRALKVNNFEGGTHHAQDWTVKQADQPLRLDTALSLFGHGGVYRTFGWLANFATELQTPDNLGTVATGDAMLRHFNALASASVIPPLSLIVPTATSRVDAIENLRAALRAVREGLAVAT